MGIVIFKAWGNGSVFKSKRNAISGDDNLRKQSTFGDATAVFPAKRRLRNERRIPFWRRVITQVMGGASDWLRISFYQSETLPRLGKWCARATRHHMSIEVHRISALVPQMSVRGETSGNFEKCWLFFFSVYLMSKKKFWCSTWVCGFAWFCQTGKKSKFGMKQTNSASVFASEVIECRRTCSSVNNGLTYR